MSIPAQLLQQYLRIEKRYSINPNEEPFFDLPSTLVLERLEYTPPDEQQIEQMARDELIVAFSKKQDEINEKYQKTIGDIEVKRQVAKNKAQLDKQNVQSNLKEKINQINFDMMRRGLLQSSICDELVKKAEADATSQNTSADWVLQLTLNELQLEEQNATEQKEFALANLQENYNIQLAKEIAELKETVAKKVESTAKYNNTQQEKESDYKRNWHSAYIDAKQSHAEMARTLLTVAINDGYEVIAEYIRQDKATFTKDYYLGFSASHAYNELVSLASEYKNHMGETHYNTVLSFFAGRL